MRVGVVGAGMMGSEIAQAAAASDLDVILVDVDEAALTRGMDHVRAIGARRVARGRMTRQEADGIVARIRPETDMSGLAVCDVVIEAVPEIMDLKRRVWSDIDASAPKGALLASNTSGLSITELGRATGRPHRVMGLHFFNPASVMRLVEVIRGTDTDEGTLAEGTALVDRLGKTAVHVRECPGFLVNRVLVRAMSEAFRHARESGADATDAAMAAIDAAAVEGPAPMGPFRLGDLVGLDTFSHIRTDLEAAYGERFSDGGVVAPLVAAGRLGQKADGGFYAEEPPETAPDEHSRAMARRYYLGALHEACLCAMDEIATLADIDTAMRLGTGWEMGPLAWADAQGLDVLADELAALAPEAPRLEVPELLARQAARGEPFIPEET